MKILSNLKKLLEPSTLTISKRYYNSVDDIILDNWIQCHNGDLTKVRKGTKGNEHFDIEFWQIIQDDYILKFGLGDYLTEIMELQKDKAIAELDFIITENRKILNKIDQLESKIKTKLISNGESVEVEDILIYMSKYYGYPINKKNITVSEYFRMINIYTKDNARSNKEE